MVFSVNNIEKDVYAVDKIPNLVPYTVPDTISDQDFERYAVEMMRYTQEDDVRSTSKQLLRFKTAEKGVARLAAVTRALGSDFIKQIQRMQ